MRSKCSGMLQREELLALRVPVRADALENAGPVVETVGEQADLGSRVMNDLDR